MVFLPAATKLGQSNIFTGVCLSIGGGRGVCLSACWDIPPGADPPEQTPPQSRHPPRADTPPEQTPPQSRHPLEQTPPRADTPQGRPPCSRHPPRADPPEQTPPREAYGQRAAVTHPTGMHSCFLLGLA